MATAGNLVFQGTALGELRAYAADTGKLLWRMPTQSGVMAAPSTFTVDGEQYVAFTTGRGGAWPLTAGHAGGAANQVPSIPRLIVLKRGGTARLPALPAAQPVAWTPPPPSGTAVQLARGKALFARFCHVCHGANAVGGGVVPDLRRSVALGDAALWRSIVIGGALKDNGMVSFARVLDPAGAEDVRRYVIAEANFAKANEAALR